MPWFVQKKDVDAIGAKPSQRTHHTGAEPGRGYRRQRRRAETGFCGYRSDGAQWGPKRGPCCRDRAGWDAIFGRDDKALSLTANEFSQCRLADAVAISRCGIEMHEAEFGCRCKQTLPVTFAEIVKTRGAESEPGCGYPGFFEFNCRYHLANRGEISYFGRRADTR